MVVVKVVRLLKETELVTLLSFDDGGRTRTETAVVNSGDGLVVMGELGVDINVAAVVFLVMVVGCHGFSQSVSQWRRRSYGIRRLQWPHTAKLQFCL